MGRRKDFNEEQAADAAKQLYWQHGYLGTSIQDLVDGLGLSRSSIYHSFGDKQQLFLMTLRSYIRRQYSDMDAAVAADGYSRRAALRLMNLVLDRAKDDELRRGCFVTNSLIELSGEDGEVHKLVQEYREHIEGLMTRCLEQDPLRPEETRRAQALARTCYALVVGINGIAKSNPEASVLEDIRTTVQDLLG